MPAAPFTRARFRAAARALAGVAHTTPLLPSQTFSRMPGCRVALKCENLQRSGSFKVRGAAVRMRALTPRERARAWWPARPGTAPRAGLLKQARHLSPLPRRQRVVRWRARALAAAYTPVRLARRFARRLAPGPF